MTRTRTNLKALAAEARACRACPLYRQASQVVFGAGSPRAALMLIGEQPGDREDLVGPPFVGAAGAVLAQALAQAELAQDEIYLTNAVKHFKFEQHGTRRLHEKPSRGEVLACRP